MVPCIVIVVALAGAGTAESPRHVALRRLRQGVRCAPYWADAIGLDHSTLATTGPPHASATFESDAEMALSWERCARYPGRRFRALVVTATRILFSVLRVRFAPGGVTSEVAAERRAASAALVVRELLRLGPTYIKIGQVASCREDLLPVEYVRELERLQDRVPASPFSSVLLTMEDELGRPLLEESFETISAQPFAAASLGQVHMATLKGSGRRVCFKVQRRGLDELYEADLRNIRRAAWVADKLTAILPKGGGGASQSWMAFYEEARKLLLREIDYEEEAANMRRFRRQFEGEEWVTCPEVVDNLSTRRVLTMEYVEGIKLTNVHRIRETPGLDERLLGERLGQAFLLQFSRDGFFHTDPHPGNLACDTAVPGGRLIFYDFGQCSELTPRESKGILDVIKAIIASDARECVKAFAEMGILSPKADRYELERTVERNFATGRIGGKRPALQEARSEGTRAALGGDGAGDGAGAEFLQLSSVYTFIFRVLAQIGGVGRTLDPHFDFVDAVAPLVATLDSPAFLLDKQLERFGLRARDLRSVVTQPRTVERIADLLDEWQRSDGSLRVRALEAERRVARLERAHARQGELIVALSCVQLAATITGPWPKMAMVVAIARWASGQLSSMRDSKS